jgi:ATP synthase protein I
MSADEEQKRQMWRKATQVSSVGLGLVISVLIGYFVGNWLDGLLKCRPWMTLLFLLLGIAAGFLNIFRTVKRYVA